jgi:hypothetical protein
MNYIICYGNPIDGFIFIGPFEDRDDAVRYAEHHMRDGGDWWITELDEPAKELT